jgi:general secretion pathway protein J
MKTSIHSSRGWRSQRATGGFTLLELIAAVAVLSILALILFEVFNQATRGWEQGQNRVESGQQARAALDFLARDLSQAIVNTNGSLPPTFSGISSEKMAFYAPVNPDLDGPDLCLVSYEVLTDTNSLKSLQRTTSTWPSGTNIVSIVAENIVSLNFDYYGGAEGTTRFGSWASTVPMPPSSVQITISNVDSRAAAKPPAQRNKEAKGFVLRVGIPNGNRRTDP